MASIIKCNPRNTLVETIAAQRVADPHTIWCHLREGKRMCMWCQALQIEGMDTQTHPTRSVLCLPSGKFETNYLVCAMAAVAINVLRLMG